MKAVFSKLLYLMEKGKNAVLVTIVDASGSAPRTAGSQMLVGVSGRIYGSIGGGAIEKASEDQAALLLAERRSAVREFSLHSDSANSIGMVCGGEVTVLFTYIPGTDAGWRHFAEDILRCIDEGRATSLLLYSDGRLPSLLDGQGGLLSGGTLTADSAQRYALPICLPHRAVIFGAGHIARALCPILKTIDFVPVIYDDRAEYAKNEFFPDAQQVICGRFADISAGLQMKPDDFVVIMTSGHAHDYAVEKQIHGFDVAYLGVVGSRSKRASVREKLLADGIPETKLNTVHTPVGTAIRAVTPEEIAISIAGEMIFVRASMRESGGYKPCPV